MARKSIFHHPTLDVILRASTVALIVPLCTMCPVWIAVNYQAEVEGCFAIVTSILSAILGTRVLLSPREPEHSIALATDTPDGPTVRFISSDDDKTPSTVKERLDTLWQVRKNLDSAVLAALDSMLASLYLAALILYNLAMTHQHWYGYRRYSTPLLNSYIIMFLFPATAIHVFFATRFVLTNSVACMRAALRCARRHNAWYATANSAGTPVVCANCGLHVASNGNGNSDSKDGGEDGRLFVKGPTVYGVEVPRDSDEVNRPETAERDPAPFGHRGDDTGLVRDDDSPRVSLIGEQGFTDA